MSKESLKDNTSFLTGPQTASRLGCTLGGVTRARDRGRIKGAVQQGAFWFYPVAEVEKYADSRKKGWPLGKSRRPKGTTKPKK